jgi:hypothetical protein
VIVGLLDTNAELDDDVFRNIVSLRASVNLFDDLTDVQAEQDAANQAEMRVRPPVPTGVISRGFAYSTAIEYPFQADNLAQSRYSDGSFPVWYGALDETTALHESAWHALQQVRQTPSVREIIHRERAVWRVRATGVFLDLRRKLADMPALIGEGYADTQALGKRLAAMHPGLVAPSARYAHGACLAAFVERVLRDPRLSYYLTYLIDPINGTVIVERSPGDPSVLLQESDLHRQ